VAGKSSVESGPRRDPPGQAATPNTGHKGVHQAVPGNSPVARRGVKRVVGRDAEPLDAAPPPQPSPPEQPGAEEGLPQDGRAEAPQQRCFQTASPSGNPEGGRSGPLCARGHENGELGSPAVVEGGVRQARGGGGRGPGGLEPAAQVVAAKVKGAPVVVGGPAGGFRRVTRATPPAAPQVCLILLRQLTPH